MPGTAGERNNRLTLLSLHAKRLGGYQWLAQCDCGNQTIVVLRDFRKGHTTSCGCYRLERLREIKVTHGRSESAEYRAWHGMFERCYNPNTEHYKYYGGRGLTVSERWQSFENFFADVGLRPSTGHSLERINNDVGYAPDNCRWATRLQQAQNRSNCVYVILRAKAVSLSEAERRLQLGKGSISGRVRRNGETHQQATEHFAARLREVRRHLRQSPA